MLSTVRKAGLVLDLFVDGQSEWGVTEVAEELEVPKSGAHSILATLTEIGLLERTADKRYRLGWQVVALSRVLLDGAAVRTAAAPLMYGLASQHAASSYLVVRERGRAMCIERITCRGTASPDAPKVGEYVPVSHPAARMLLLSKVPRADAIGGDSPVREASAPIPSDGQPVAVLSVSLDPERFTASAATELARSAAHRVSRRIVAQDVGHRPPATFVKVERGWSAAAAGG